MFLTELFQKESKQGLSKRVLDTNFGHFWHIFEPLERVIKITTNNCQCFYVRNTMFFFFTKSASNGVGWGSEVSKKAEKGIFGPFLTSRLPSLSSEVI